MKVEVSLPFPIVLVRKGFKRLVLFAESPPLSFVSDPPWPSLQYRGAALLDAWAVERQSVFRDDLTLLLSGPPLGEEGEPEEAFERLLRGENPCSKVFAGFNVCGNVAFAFGKREAPPVGPSVWRTRVSLTGVKMVLLERR